MSELFVKKVDYFAQLAKFSTGLKNEFAEDKEWAKIASHLMDIAYLMQLSVQKELVDQGCK